MLLLNINIVVMLFSWNKDNMERDIKEVKFVIITTIIVKMTRLMVMTNMLVDG